MFLSIYLYISLSLSIYIYIHIYIYIYIYHALHHPGARTREALLRLVVREEADEAARLGRGDDTVGSPHQAQMSQFELFELKFLNSSLSSCLYYRQTAPRRAIRGKSSDSRQQHLSQQYPPPKIMSSKLTTSCN